MINPVFKSANQIAPFAQLFSASQFVCDVESLCVEDLDIGLVEDPQSGMDEHFHTGAPDLPSKRFDLEGVLNRTPPTRPKQPLKLLFEAEAAFCP